MNHLAKALEIDELPNSGIRYTICTLVSRLEEYAEMLESFEKAGFKNTFCEFLFIDNSKKNKYDAFKGLNLFLAKASGEFIILCHQDIILNHDNIEVLEQRIQEINSLDPQWAIISNAGAGGIKNIVYRITESDNVLHRRGAVPREVVSVDENFILVKASANLALSRDLSGFHLYGTELCLIARSLGYSSYVVDFNLYHKSKGKTDESFFKIREAMIKKYLKAWEGRYIQTTMTNFYISGSRFRNALFTSRIIMFLSRQYYKMKFRNKNLID